MLSEQTISSKFRISDQHPTMNVRIAIRVEVPAGEPDVDVAMDLIYEPKLPDHLRETIHSNIYNGIYDSIASTGFPLPSDGIKITVSQLEISPLSITITDEQEIQRLGVLIHDLTMNLVSDLWARIR